MPGASATGSYFIAVDADGDDTNHPEFRVVHDAGKSTIFEVADEDDYWCVYGPLERNGTHEVRRTSTTGTISDFNTRTCGVSTEGKGDFTVAGIKVPVVTSTPNGSRSGTAGDLLVYHDTGAGQWYLAVCTGGTAWTAILFVA